MEPDDDDDFDLFAYLTETLKRTDLTPEQRAQGEAALKRLKEVQTACFELLKKMGAEPIQ